MRTRLIRPEFWADATMGSIPPLVRLTYIGTWCLADDAGYLNWDHRDIAAELYRYQPVGTRERQVKEQLDKLVEAGRIQVLECREHAVIPTIPDHRMKGGEQLYTIKKQHDRRCTTSNDGGLRSPTEPTNDVELRRTPSRISGQGSDSHSLPTPRATADGSDLWSLVQLAENLLDRPFGYGRGAWAFDTLEADFKALGHDRIAEAMRAERAAEAEPMDPVQLVKQTHHRLFPLNGRRRANGKHRSDARQEDLDHAFEH